MDTATKASTKTTKEIVQEALNNSMSYEAYRDLVRELAANNSNTGPEKTPALANYTQLSDKRMKRWDKTLKISPEIEAAVAALPKKTTWLVITESWCGDASPSVPVMNKLATLNPDLDLKVVLRDENLELMDQFLTNGGRSIPKLIALDAQTQEVIADWGPRSTKATKLVEDYKAAHGKISAELKQDLQVFYNKDKGEDILNDLVSLLK